jgi:hypothetical protein
VAVIIFITIGGDRSGAGEIELRFDPTLTKGFGDVLFENDHLPDPLVKR